MKDMCKSCRGYKKVAAWGVFVPHNGGNVIIYPICGDCVKEAMSHPEHKEAVIAGIEKHIDMRP